MRMVSVDPGTVTCGVAVWDIDDNFNISSLYSFTIYIDNNLDLNTRLNNLYNIFKEIMKDLQPYQLAHESGFINRFRPQAYGPIYTTIYLLELAYKEIISPYGIFSYSPKYVKSIVSSGDANKDDMLLAVNKIKEVKQYLTGYETEHEIDAIAIGYSHLLNIRYMPEILFI